jgi:Arc/MetJ-type ribon-helix-helix transcriptional regulator
MTRKIAISLPDELVESARKAVAENRAASVSAYIAEAMIRHEQAEGLGALLADWDREFGPPSAKDVAWAKQQLGLS